MILKPFIVFAALVGAALFFLLTVAEKTAGAEELAGGAFSTYDSRAYLETLRKRVANAKKTEDQFRQVRPRHPGIGQHPHQIKQRQHRVRRGHGVIQQHPKSIGQRPLRTRGGHAPIQQHPKKVRGAHRIAR